jgi:hypothetical protein
MLGHHDIIRSLFSPLVALETIAAKFPPVYLFTGMICDLAGRAFARWHHLGEARCWSALSKLVALETVAYQTPDLPPPPFQSDEDLGGACEIDPEISYACELGGARETTSGVSPPPFASHW